MATGLLYDCDEYVANCVFDHYRVPRLKVDRALGLVKNGVLVGAALFHGYNGCNIEISYYGVNTLTPGIVRAMARFAIETFNVGRATAITSKRNKRWMRSLIRFGFHLEGVQRCYYGHADTNRNAGVRFVLRRDQLEVLARLAPKKAA